MYGEINQKFQRDMKLPDSLDHLLQNETNFPVPILPMTELPITNESKD